MDQDKRLLRKLKRNLKRTGSKRRRRQLKQDLLAKPEEAHETEFDFGGYGSAGMNGLDRDATRRKKEAE